MFLEKYNVNMCTKVVVIKLFLFLCHFCELLHASNVPASSLVFGASISVLAGLESDYWSGHTKTLCFGTVTFLPAAKCEDY